MARKQMIATGPLRYGTRMLSAGDGLSVDGPKARLLAALGRAHVAVGRPQPSRARDDYTGGSVAGTEGDMKALRAQYRAKFGKGPGPSWSAATLAEKIASS